MEPEPEKPKWSGKVTAQLRNCTAESVWKLVQDFFSLANWLPTIDTCSRVDATLRYCAAAIPATNGGDGAVRWCYEKLVSVDPIRKCLIYQVLENNMGLNNYTSAKQVTAIDGGCVIEWSFSCDPVEGLECAADLVNYLDISLQGMAKRMEKELECWQT